MRARLSLLPSIVLLACLLAGCSAADSPGLLSVTVMFGGEHTLGVGERQRGDVYALAGNLVVEQGATIDGSLLALGGETRVAGAVTGDVSLLGGRLELTDMARVGGALTVGGGELDRAAGAEVAGGITQGAPALSPASRPTPSFAERMLNLLLPALGAALIAYLLARYLPRPFARVAAALGEHALVSAALGLLAGITALVLLVLVAFTVVLIPFSILGGAGLFAAVGYGWAAWGAVVGGRLAARLRHPLTAPAAASIGAFLFTWLAGLLRFVPLVGDALPPLLAAAGLGAVFLTRFGLRTFVPAQDDAPLSVPEN